MRLLLAVAFLTLSLGSVGCRAGQIQNLRLAWKGVNAAPQPSPSVAQALASVPIAFGLRDVRPDPTAVGKDEETGHIVRTTDDVAQFASNKVGEMLRAAGARFDEPPAAVVEADLTEYNVNEGGTFNGAVAIRVTLRRGDAVVWSKSFRGQSKRWGRTHNPENFNETLSNALSEATGQLISDEEFATALMGGGPAQPQLPPPPPPPPELPPPPPGS